MARNGSGVYSLPAGNPVVTGTTISSTVHNNTMNDLAAEMTNSTDKDGQTGITGTWDYNGNKIILDAGATSSLTADTNNILDFEIASVDAVKFGWQGVADTGFLTLDPAAFTADTTENTHRVAVLNSQAITIPSGTTALVSGVYLTEPNITATGTVTTAATLYIKAAPTEGATNYALWVDAGNVKLDGNLTVTGTQTFTGGTTFTGAVSIDDTTDTTSGTTGSLHTDGGLGVAKKIFAGDSITTDTLVLDAGSITDTSGAITFGNENLVTTGTFGAGAITGTVGTFTTSAIINSDITITSGSIVSASGAITFGNENLTTTGTLASGAFTATDGNAILALAGISQDTLHITGVNAGLILDTVGSNFPILKIKKGAAEHFVVEVDTGSNFAKMRAGTGQLILQSLNGSVPILLEHSHATQPLGLQVDFSFAAPNDRFQYFHQGIDSGATKFTIWSDGGADFSGKIAITDTADEIPLNVTATSSTAVTAFTQNTATSTNFHKYLDLGALTVWISDGTTAEGALTGVEGDICLNGGTGAGQMAYCDAAGTNWTDM